MPWPNGEDYCEAVQNLRACRRRRGIRPGQPKCDTLGDPLLWAWQFRRRLSRRVSQRQHLGVKCFTCEVADRQRRYREIAAPPETG